MSKKKTNAAVAEKNKSENLRADGQPPSLLFRTTQPADWIEAFKKSAAAKGMTLSEWTGESLKAKLPSEVRRSLSARPGAHRPKGE